MMKNNKRLLGLGALIGLGMMVSGPASAYNMNYGGWDIQVDLVSSAGLSVRVADRDNSYLPAWNGGNLDMTAGVDPVGAALGLGCGTADAPSAWAQSLGSLCMYNQSFVATVGGAELYNYDGSINTDDARLNFDKGDLISGNAKLTADFEAVNGPMTVFVRMTGFYDAVLGSSSSYERAGPQDFIENDISRKIDVLDAYLSYDFDVAGKPAMVRVGRQVINWGESTFFLGGNSVFSPIDVGTLRRPGAEIKEALLPVEALYGSVALNEAVSIEAYVGGWDNFKLDVGGTPFANSDALVLGSGANRTGSLVGSSPYSGYGKRLCGTVVAAQLPYADGLAAAAAAAGGAYVGASSAQLAAAWNAVAKAGNDVFGACASGDDIDILTQHRLGYVEADRMAISNVVQAGALAGTELGDTAVIRRLDDDGASDEQSYGLAVRWYSEELNSTEFGFYYQRYNSRIPYVNTVAYAPILGPTGTTPTSSSTGRGLAGGGCMTNLGANLPAGNLGALFVNANALATLSGISYLDPTGLGDQIRANYADPAVSAPILEAATANLDQALGANSPGAATISALMAAQVAAALAMPDNSIAQGEMLGCINTIATMYPLSGTTFLTGTGAPTYAMNFNTGFQLVYPEIDVYGVSFNTTIGGWGVQGEVAYRPDMPLQIDTDALTISALSGSCAWENYSGLAAYLGSLQTIANPCGNFGSIQGYVEEDVWNLDIGTTATFTRSNSLINMLGADLGILLTEFGAVHADVDEYRTSANVGGNVRLLNKCTSGSYLPLGGIFALDPRPVRDCQPTQWSSGALIMTQLQYNNFLGTPLSIKPQLIVSYGLSGMSPTPAGGFTEGNQTRSFSVTADYMSNLSVQLSYTDFKGKKLYTRDNDRDFASVSVTYSF